MCKRSLVGKMFALGLILFLVGCSLELSIIDGRKEDASSLTAKILRNPEFVTSGQGLGAPSSRGYFSQSKVGALTQETSLVSARGYRMQLSLQSTETSQ